MTRKTWLLAPAVGTAAICLAVESTRRAVHVESGRAPAAKPVIEPSEETAPASPTLAREAVPVEKRLVADEAEDSPDPPTPERPGPGQALLRVEVVALETGTPLSGARLCMSSTDDLVEHEWLSSTQPDPSRGVENDDVITDAEGRCTFVLQTDFAYTLYGDGEDGLADGGAFELEPFHEGEVREVRFALPTAWDLEWEGRVIDGETKRPIAGAEVEVLAQDSEKCLDELHVLARGRTGPDGRVLLRLPAWERFCARARAPGYSWNGPAPECGDSLFALRRPAALEAAVIGVDGEPAAGIEVRVHVRPDQLIPFVPFAMSCQDVEWRATTDATGSCRFEELPAGSHRDGDEVWDPVDLAIDLGRNDHVLLRPEKVNLEPRERRRVEWRLTSGCRVTGVVRDHQGQIMPNVPLSLIRIDGPLWIRGLRKGDLTTAEDWEQGEECRARLRSADDGTFEIDDVGAGSWAIGPPEDEEDLPAAQVVFEIEPRQSAEEVDLELARGKWIRGVALDPDGKPARDIHVSCAGIEERLAHFERDDWTRRDGSFALGPLLSDDYRVVAGGSEDPLHGISTTVDARAGDQHIRVQLRWAG